jgi:hypothetical protein
MLLFNPEGPTDGIPTILRKAVAHSHARGRLDAVDRIGEHLKTIPENLEIWAELGISAGSPTNGKWLGCDDNAAVLISPIYSTEYNAVPARSKASPRQPPTILPNGCLELSWQPHNRSQQCNTPNWAAPGSMSLGSALVA